MTLDLPGETPEGAILNYSIVSSDDDDNPLVVKLKVSQSNKVPVVVLKKLQNVDDYALSPRTSTRIRKSRTFENYETDLSLNNIRKLERESLSPKKRTRSQKKIDDCEMVSPQKKGKIADDAVDSLCDSIKNNVQIKTPVKKNEQKTPVKTPRSARGRRLETPSPSENKFSRTPRRICDSNSPLKSVKVNLDESFRRSVLRQRQQNVDNQKNSQTEDVIKRTPVSRRLAGKGMPEDTEVRKSARKTRSSYAAYSYDTEDDDIQMVEALKRSEEDYVPRRVLRSRSNSSASVNSLDSNESDKQFVPRTPRSRRNTMSTPKKLTSTPKTPKSTLKQLRDGTITPSMQSRSTMIPKDSTPLMKARTQLHVSYVPNSLPCREKEYQDIYCFLKGKLEDGYGGCMYISGVPGTGKTATVTSVIDRLKTERKLPKFDYVNVNGMRLTEPRQAYVEIWKQLTDKTIPWEQAQNLLEQRFTKKKHHTPVVMLIDELDILCTKRQDVVYNLLDWPTKSNDQLIVITIANTMDLPERLLMSRVTSRLGLTRLTFQAYTHKQLMEIVTKRLTGTESFNPDAVQLVARKVASVSGDARRALDICRRAAEIAENENQHQQVSIAHINQALNAMITQPQVMAIRRCSRLQKLLLQAVVAEIERTGVEETTFSDVFRMLVSCCALDGLKMVSSVVAQRALSQLSACRLIITDQKCRDVYQKIILNVSVHDVYFALKKEQQ
ncbi:origin recognition complex subunit 1 [Rhynchophorus ferrugineus]|uniref:origin recognition complex subunit 1 n=1 Tax=Rhynchophorus ferrugineus TaxID=354439 RepID=UPI003FCC587C